MKKTIKTLLCISVVSCSIQISYANEMSCESTWNIKAKGISIGITSEKYLNHNGVFEILSHFKPYKTFSFLGVPELKRMAISDKNSNLIYRKETVNPISENLVIEWIKLSGNQWQQTINNVKQKSWSIDLTTIDSTMFPYLLILNKVSIKDNNDFMAMGKSDPYGISFKLEEIPEGIKLYSSVDNGYIVFNKNKEPIGFGANQQGSKIVGERISWKCFEK